MTYMQVIATKLPSFLATILLRMQQSWERWRSPPPPSPAVVVPPPSPPPVVAPPPEEFPPSTPVALRNQWDMSRKGVEDSGTFYFKKNILDDLGYYFRALERFRATDPEAYGLYSQVGGTVVPSRALAPIHELPALWSDRKSRPAFGCTWLGGYGEDDRERVWVRFAYFQKVKQLPPMIERMPSNYDIYRMHIFFDNPNLATERKWRRFLKKHGYVLDFYIGVDPDGNCQVLKTLQVYSTTIDYRDTTSRGGKTRKQLFTQVIPCTKFDYPEAFQSLYQDHRYKKDFADIHDFAEMYLALTANFCIGNETAIRVDASNGKGIASFSVDWKRTAYFFKDRDTVLTDRGKKARIFHIVRPHERQVGNKAVSVHMHFRGLRRFKWNGYDVRVSVPGLHHVGVHTFTPAACELDDLKEGKTMKQVGSALQQHVQGVQLRKALNLDT